MAAIRFTVVQSVCTFLRHYECTLHTLLFKSFFVFCFFWRERERDELLLLFNKDALKC